jgi:hypothetical protein
MGKAVATHPDTTPAERERMVLDYQREVPEPMMEWENQVRFAILTQISEGLLAYCGDGMIQLTEAGVTKHQELRQDKVSDATDTAMFPALE